MNMKMVMENNMDTNTNKEMDMDISRSRVGYNILYIDKRFNRVSDIMSDHCKYRTECPLMFTTKV